jgi:hypothetical protein
MIGINETANVKMTVGLTINQGAYDDQILAFKSSDISHGMTVLVGTDETDTYAFFKKTNNTEGGLLIETITEGGSNVIATILAGTAVVQNTTKSTSGRALHEIRGFDTLSTSRQNIGTATTDSNILGVYDGTTQRWVVDSSGNTWQGGGATFGGDVGLSGSILDSATGNPRVRLGSSMIRSTSTSISQAAGAAEVVGWGNNGSSYTMAFVTAVRSNTAYTRSIYQIAFSGSGSALTVISSTGTSHQITFTCNGSGRLLAQATYSGDTFDLDVLELSPG